MLSDSVRCQRSTSGSQFMTGSAIFRNQFQHLGSEPQRNSRIGRPPRHPGERRQTAVHTGPCWHRDSATPPIVARGCVNSGRLWWTAGTPCQIHRPCRRRTPHDSWPPPSWGVGLPPGPSLFAHPQVKQGALCLLQARGQKEGFTHPSGRKRL